MEFSCTLSFSCVLFVILVKGFVCQFDNLNGMCWDEYEHEIETIEDQGNDSQLSNITDTVYMDMAKVPRFENSTCYCTVTFTNEREDDLNSVRLDYKTESSTEALTVNGYGFDRFSTKNDVHVVGTILKMNNVTFTLKTPETAFKACLRIASDKTNAGESLFRAKCFANQFTPEINTSSSTKTSSTPPSTTSGESTTETEFGAVIGGIACGGAVLVILIVIVIVVLVIKRKKTKTTKANNEDYYMTENDLYNVRNSSIKSANEKTYDTYDEIEAANQTRESRVYAEVDTNKNKPTENTQTLHTVDGNEYNHLNGLVGPVSTGNIYSSIGTRGSESDANIYNSANQGTLGNASSGSRDDNIYNTSNES